MQDATRIEPAFITGNGAVFNCHDSAALETISDPHAAGMRGDCVPGHGAIVHVESSAPYIEATSTSSFIASNRAVLNGDGSLIAENGAACGNCAIACNDAVNDRKLPAVVNRSTIELHPIAESHIVQGEIAGAVDGNEAIAPQAFLACDLAAVARDRDRAADHGQAGVAMVISIGPGECVGAPGWQHDRIRSASCRAVQMGRGVVVGIDDRLDQRALAITVFNTGLMSGDGSRRRLHALSEL